MTDTIDGATVVGFNPIALKGDKGETGLTGAPGAAGMTPNLTIGTVTTVPTGQAPSASITGGDPANPVLNLQLPSADLTNYVTVPTTGTATSSTFLRGDGAWATPAAALPTYAGTARSNRYSQEHNLYNGQPANLFHLRRLAASCKQGGTAKILTIGDSTVAGAGATAQTSWPMQLRAMLVAAGCSLRGTGTVFASQGITDTRWSSTGTVTGSGSFAQISSTGTKTFVSDVAGTSVDICIFNSSTGNAAWDIDSGARTGTITPAGGTTIQKVTVATGLANTTHTVKVTASGGTVFLISVNVYGATGLQISNMGVSGTKVLDWKVTSGVANFPMAVTDTPDLIIVQLGVNDAGGSTNLTTMLADYTTVLTNCQALAPTMVVVPLNSSGVTTAAMGPYASLCYDLADAKGVAAVDLFARWTSYANANTYGLIADSIHPNAKGYSDLAQAFFALI